jgi:hypothetical protein
MENCNYEIGQEYRYPLGRRKFKLKETNGFVFLFECGHWCTDNVFVDLINVKTKIQNYKNNQLKLL